MAEFKNGDRVRFTRANPCGGVIYGQSGEEAVVIDALRAGDHAAHGKLVRVQRDSGGFNPIVPVSALALVSAADTRAADTRAADTRPGEYFELVTEAAGSDDDADRWNAKALREEYRERLSTLTLTELPQFINDLLSEKIDKNVANSVVGLIASASSKVIRDKLKGA
ncbi:hypothetical protein [Sinorhizobium phage phiM5]|nr:hypothetical protein [Sinorhizobium phage phiM5]